MIKNQVMGAKQFGNLSEEVKKMTFGELADKFIRQSKIKGRSDMTIRSYKYHSSYFTDFLEQQNNTFTKNITEETLEDYIKYIQDVKQITNVVTINSYLRNISPIIKFGYKKGYILEDITIPVIKGQETFKEIYTNEELKTILEHPKKNDFINIRTWTMLWVLSSTGIRARELRELQLKHVNMLDRTILLNKTKNKQPRIVPISQSLLSVLEEYLKLRKGDAEDYLFPSVYNGIMAMSTLQKCVKIYMNERGIEKTSLHLFRHTFITNAVNNNISPLILKRITGHSTLQQLNRYYNAKTTDLVAIIDNIAPTKPIQRNPKRSNQFKKGGK